MNYTNSFWFWQRERGLPNIEGPSGTTLIIAGHYVLTQSTLQRCWVREEVRKGQWIGVKGGHHWPSSWAVEIRKRPQRDGDDRWIVTVVSTPSNFQERKEILKLAHRKVQWRLFRLRAIWEYMKLERESPSKDSRCRCCGEHRARGQTVCRMLGFERNLGTTLPPYFIVEKTRRGVWVRSWFGIQILSLSSLESALIHQFLILKQI